MSVPQFTPALPHVLLHTFAQVIQASGEPVHFRAVGFRIGSALEITVYCGDIVVTSFSADAPSVALTGLVNFTRSVRAAGVPCRVTLLVHAASLPF